MLLLFVGFRREANPAELVREAGLPTTKALNRDLKPSDLLMIKPTRKGKFRRVLDITSLGIVKLTRNEDEPPDPRL